MRLYITVVLLGITIFGHAQGKEKPITEYVRQDTKEGILLDVRTPEEFKAGHLEHALNIDWFSSDFAQQCKAFDKEDTVYVYCKKGGRSAKAVKVLDSLGYKNIFNLVGGYDAVLK